MKKNDILLLLGFTALMAVINVVLVRTHCLAWEGAWDWQSLGTMIGAAITIAVMSQLYKDNPLFKMAEHMLVGSALGYGLVVSWYSMWVNEIIPGIQPLGQYGAMGQFVAQGVEIGRGAVERRLRTATIRRGSGDPPFRDSSTRRTR